MVFTRKHAAVDAALEEPSDDDSALACEVIEDPRVAQAHTLVAHFYKRFHGLDNVTPQPKELEHAMRVIDEHGVDGGLYIVNFSHQAAAESRYTPQTFGGILHYTTHAMAAHDTQRQHASTAQSAVRETALRERYEAYRREELARLREALTLEELATLEQQAHTRLVAEKTPAFTMGLAVRMAVDEVLEAKAGLPPFDVWRQHQET
jgi:hypothetical protein